MIYDVHTCDSEPDLPSIKLWHFKSNEYVQLFKNMIQKNLIDFTYSVLVKNIWTRWCMLKIFK